MMGLKNWLIAGVLGAAGLGLGAPALAQEKPAEARSAPAGAADESGKVEAPVKPKVVVFRLNRTVSEKPSEDLALFGGVGSVSLRDLVSKMKKAAKDPEVKGVALLLDGASLGLAQVEELRQAMRFLRENGKPVHAHADELTTGGLALLSGATRLSVVPTGDVWLTGLYAESPYLRGMLDKLGVEPDYLSCGDYKSAGEIFMRNGPSPEAQEMENWLLDSTYQTVVNLIADGRKTTPEKVREWIDGGPYSAERAHKAGIIDAAEHRQDFEAALKQSYGEDLVFDKKYGQKEEPKPDFSSPFGLIKFWGELLGSASKKSDEKKAAVGIVYVEGAIALGSRSEMAIFGSEGALSTPIRRALDEAAADDSIKAVVLRVDSPGGSAVASEIILDATRRLKTKKPFTVSMGNVAGSGGYYVACASDLIFADRSTITGSIGVVGGKFGTEGLFDKVGVNFHSTQRGKNAGMLASSKPFTPEERERIQAWMDEVYEVFRGHVRASRGDRLKKPLDELSGGRVYTGEQALELGLVDRIGTLEDAIAHVADQASLADYEVRTFPKAKSFIEILLDEDSETDRKGLDVRLPILELAVPYLKVLDPARADLVKRALQRLELLQSEGVILMTPEIRFGG